MASARELIDRAKSAPDTFDVITSTDGTEVIKFRNIKDLRMIMARKEKSKALLKVSQDKSVPPAWRPFLPITVEMADIMAELVLDAIEPTFTDMEALELCAENGVLAGIIHVQIQNKMLESMARHELEAITAEKNGLRPMDSGGLTSPSAKKSSASTPTTSPKPIGNTHAST